jgi:hypothetical protein
VCAVALCKLIALAIDTIPLMCPSAAATSLKLLYDESRVDSFETVEGYFGLLKRFDAFIELLDSLGIRDGLLWE